MAPLPPHGIPDVDTMVVDHENSARSGGCSGARQHRTAGRAAASVALVAPTAAALHECVHPHAARTSRSALPPQCLARTVARSWSRFEQSSTCARGHAEASVTGLQLMSAAVHLDAAWSPSTGREARREENAASRSHQGEFTVTAPAACTAAVAAGRCAAWKH